MNYCRTCGRPKELHDLKKITPPLGPVIHVRRCLLIVANVDEVAEGKAARMKADAGEYNMRQAAYDAERAELPQDREEELAEWKKEFHANDEVAAAWKDYGEEGK